MVAGLLTQDETADAQRQCRERSHERVARKRHECHKQTHGEGRHYPAPLNAPQARIVQQVAKRRHEPLAGHFLPIEGESLEYSSGHAKRSRVKNKLPVLHGSLWSNPVSCCWWVVWRRSIPRCCYLLTC